MIYVFIGIAVIIVWGIYMEIKYPQQCNCPTCRIINFHVKELNKKIYEQDQKDQLKEVLKSHSPYRQYER